MGYSEVVFFRFAGVLLFRTFVAAQRPCFFRQNEPYRFVGRTADPRSLRRGLVFRVRVIATKIARPRIVVGSRRRAPTGGLTPPARLAYNRRITNTQGR